MRGGLFENLVISEMMKNRCNANQPAPFYFWKDNNAVEVDLVVNENGQTDLFEIKSSFTIKSDFWKGIASFRKTAPHLAGSNYVVYGGDEKQVRTAGTFMPWRSISQL